LCQNFKLTALLWVVYLPKICALLYTSKALKYVLFLSRFSFHIVMLAVSYKDGLYDYQINGFISALAS